MNSNVKTQIPFKTGYIYRQTLLHLTPVENAESIISSQHFIAGDGLFGKGVYFANRYEATIQKTAHHNRNHKWTLLVADVYIGKYVVVEKNDAIRKKINVNQLKNQGITTIFGIKLGGGREIVCLDENRIKNIKYAFGEKPKAFYNINRPRETLFKVVSINEARRIHSHKSFDESYGPFGKAIYLFYTLTDAVNGNTNGTTYLSCDAMVGNPYYLNNGETLRTNNTYSKGSGLFIANHSNCTYYIFTNPRLISNIHFCGGLNWN